MFAGNTSSKSTRRRMANTRIRQTSPLFLFFFSGLGLQIFVLKLQIAGMWSFLREQHWGKNRLSCRRAIERFRPCKQSLQYKWKRRRTQRLRHASPPVQCIDTYTSIYMYVHIHIHTLVNYKCHFVRHAYLHVCILSCVYSACTGVCYSCGTLYSRLCFTKWAITIQNDYVW